MAKNLGYMLMTGEQNTGLYEYKLIFRGHNFIHHTTVKQRACTLWFHWEGKMI